MNERTNNKKQVFFYGNFKYTGYLESETPTHFIVLDDREGIIQIPKHNTLVKEVKQ